MADGSEKIAITLSRFGLAFVFLYAAIASSINPETWMGFLPVWLSQNFDPILLIRIFSAYEIILVAWILSGKYSFYSAIVSAITLLGIISSNTGNFDIVFRDVDIMVSAIALAIVSRRNENGK